MKHPLKHYRKLADGTLKLVRRRPGFAIAADPSGGRRPSEVRGASRREGCEPLACARGLRGFQRNPGLALSLPFAFLYRG